MSDLGSGIFLPCQRSPFSTPSLPFSRDIPRLRFSIPRTSGGRGVKPPGCCWQKTPPLGTLISPLPTQPLDPCTYAGHRTLTVGGHLLRVIVHARGLEQRTAKPAESAPNGATRRSVSRHQGQPPQKTARSGGSRCEAWIVGVLKRPWLVRGEPSAGKKFVEVLKRPWFGRG